MEVNRRLESFLIAEPSVTHLDHRDLAVGTLGMTVVGIQNNRVENAPQVLLNHPRHFLDRLQSAAYRPAIPSLPALLSPGPADVVPQRHGVLLDAPGSRRLQAALSKPLEGTPLLYAHVLRVGLPAILASLEQFIAFFHQCLMLLATYLVDRIPQIFGYVELIEGDLLLRPGETFEGRANISRPHIHGDAFNSRSLLLTQSVIEGDQALFLAVVGNMNDMSLFLVGDHRHIVMTLAKGRLIDPHSLIDSPVVSWLKSLADGPLHDAVDGVPTLRQLSADCADRGFLQPVDHQALEQGREARATFSPGHLDQADIMFRIIDPRNVGRQDSLVLTGIQMPPLLILNRPGFPGDSIS